MSRCFSRIISTAMLGCMLSASTGALANAPSALSVAIDNDLLTPSGRDQDYTAGLTIAYSAPDLDESAFYFDGLLRGLDNFLDAPRGQSESRSVEFGLYGFTPEQAAQGGAGSNDRPYASILYMGSSVERVDPKNQTAWRSAFTIGLLGLDTFANLQRDVHKATGSRKVQGWGRQISDGGELTARYQLHKQQRLPINNSALQAKVSRHFSVGYLTEAGISISGRYGNVYSPWWRFNPEATSYGEQMPMQRASLSERYVFFGAALKARLYNSFLQGQFRDSAHSYSGGEVRHALLEVWAGYSHGFANGYRLSYVVRGHSSEVKSGQADRDVFWGGLVMNKTWF